MKKITYEEHIKELLKKKAIKAEFEKLIPEYELAKSIIEQRLRKKMTQEDISKKAGIPQSTVSRIERLTHGLPKISSLKKIANALDAKLVIKLETRNTLKQYMSGVNYEKPLTIKEARKHYGKKTRS
jgi:transcriptional regulator with XRE-family HTH domain